MFYLFVVLFHLVYFIMPLIFITFSFAWVMIVLGDAAWSDGDVIKNAAVKALLGMSVYVSILFTGQSLIYYIMDSV